MTSSTTPARPLLAVLHLRTRRPHDPAFQVTLDALNAPTVRVSAELGWDVVPVACAEVPPEVTAELVDRADAVVLMGGEDVDPSFYGGASTYPGSGHHEPDADQAHIDAVHRCLAAGTPLLGICRGLQVLNVALGGTLVQHLGSQRHRAEGDDHFVRNRVTVTHDGLGAAVDASQDVRCAHHQAVDRVADGLLVAARAADGVVEAVVHETAPITGVQWHPEHAETADLQLGALLRRLTEQAPVARSAS
ncbi:MULTISPECIES: gamma-glutamyl-gamma-aminobutyrate hydrolase family protein [Aeromicrobium]|uniref:gamma-glutamyl-gamma-aminobutyrate hydrolase family protein n=1 Tax=Aeromicrobium TaxID=2040 RepID=UPI00257DB58E|nr:MULTISPECIES: gamma-glutamyl-gamma-aminobutyrate hydrolase family protein [Aeromicrobium]